MDMEYTRRLGKIEAVLQHWLPERADASWAGRVFPGLGGSVPENCLESLAGPDRDLLSRGGKRWRPLLMLLVCESLGGGQAALPLVPLVEFCHNASLIHDDIEDNSDQRRGKPAVHLIYGLDAAINSGAFFYFLPLACLDGWEAPAAQKERVFSVWGEHMRRLHLGQAMDIHWHRNFESLPGIEEYYTMCGLKTGCLARLAAALGVLAAIPGGETADRDRRDRAVLVLGEAAEKLGIGFQILDDVKNLTTGLPGKKRGDDVVEGKKSLPVLLYLHGAGKKAGSSRQGDGKERGKLVARCFTGAREGGASAPEVEELIAELEAAGTLEEAREKGLALIRDAGAVFSGNSAGAVPLEEEGRLLLAGLTDLIS
ncbi:MAG: polyprenyl synthetase family protein [Treponema sp.]|jgi:octaprenyl-diphosphate synthase|nr:polyprenyl synthetase family protein [Treponema sp.]